MSVDGMPPAACPAAPARPALAAWLLRMARLLPLLLACSLPDRAAASSQQITASDVQPQDRVFTARSDGTEQRYVLQLPADFQPEQPASLLLALHGHGSDRWQFIRHPRDECRATREIAARHQLILVAPDYRATTSWLGPAAEADLLQLLDELHGQFRVDKVLICGGSMGGTAAAAFAALHPECVDGVIAMNPTVNMLEYDGFADAVAAAYGGTKSEKPEEYRRRSAELFPERLTMPLAFTTGGRDTVVPPDSVLRLVQQLRTRQHPVTLIHRPEGGHDTSYADALAAFQAVTQQVFRTAAGESPAEAIAAAVPQGTALLSQLAPDRRPLRIVCLGDSVTGVYYHTGGVRAWPELLQSGLQRLLPEQPVVVINAGISGHTTAEGLARLESDVLSHMPDLAVLSFGLNDMTRVPAEQFQANLQQLVERCRSGGVHPVLCTPNAVIDTAARPVTRLEQYCDIIRTVGRQLTVPVCDQYRTGQLLQRRAPWTWRLTMSDEIHPNLDGHRRMAEQLCRTIAGRMLALDTVSSDRPALLTTRDCSAAGRPVGVLAMTPLDMLWPAAWQRQSAPGDLQVTAWPTEGKSLVELEQSAQAVVRARHPDLVLLTFPQSPAAPDSVAAPSGDEAAGALDAAAAADEEFVHATSWLMNWSLSFGRREWDCVVVHPDVLQPQQAARHAAWIRRLVHAQDLPLIDRRPGDDRPAEDIIADWLSAQPPQ